MRDPYYNLRYIPEFRYVGVSGYTVLQARPLKSGEGILVVAFVQGGKSMKSQTSGLRRLDQKFLASDHKNRNVSQDRL